MNVSSTRAPLPCRPIVSLFVFLLFLYFMRLHGKRLSVLQGIHCEKSVAALARVVFLWFNVSYVILLEDLSFLLLF